MGETGQAAQGHCAVDHPVRRPAGPCGESVDDKIESGEWIGGAGTACAAGLARIDIESVGKPPDILYHAPAKREGL